MKDRGLLALLVLSPGQRRTRQWLQDKLWSDRRADQAAHSCRQALTAIRQALGPEAARLKSDRATVWLSPAVDVVLEEPGEVLADLDIRDPEFTDWLRDLRQGLAEQGSAAASPPVTASSRPVAILLRRGGRPTTDRAAFLGLMIRTRIEQEMAALGEVAVIQHDEEDSAERDVAADALIELESVEDGGCWFLLLRISALPTRRILWTGRLSLSLDVAALWNAPEVHRLVNQAVGALSDQVAGGAGRVTTFAAVRKAVRRIYDFEKAGLAAADELLRQVEDRDPTGLALAWRGFIGLTAALEYRDASPDLGARSLALVESGLARQAGHPVSLALASQVHLRLGGDTDRALYLARRAVDGSEANPYALDALALALAKAGDPEGGYRAALAGRQAAQGLVHAFCWEMQCCLSALGLDLRDEALDHALTSHRLMPYYRPPLRYLVALSVLANRPADARHYAQKLRRLEPDFTEALLLQPNYPVHTLRDLGHLERLRPALV